MTATGHPEFKPRPLAPQAKLQNLDSQPLTITLHTLKHLKASSISSSVKSTPCVSQHARNEAIATTRSELGQDSKCLHCRAQTKSLNSKPQTFTRARGSRVRTFARRVRTSRYSTNGILPAHSHGHGTLYEGVGYAVSKSSHKLIRW